MELTKEEKDLIGKLILDVANEIVGYAKDNGRMAIQDEVAREQFLTTCPRLIHRSMEALRATLIAILEGTISDNK